MLCQLKTSFYLTPCICMTTLGLVKNICMNSTKNQVNKIKVSVGVIIQDADNKILLGKRKNVIGDGTWGIPGGHLKIGESIAECAKREVYDEVGIDLKNLELVEVCEIVNTGQDFQLVEIGYKTKKWEGIVELKEHKYCSEWGFFPLDSLPGEIFEAHKSIVEKVFKQHLNIEEKEVDTDPSLFDFIHPHFKVAVQSFVVNKAGQLLMGLRCDPENKGYWAVPGGHLDVGDTLEECSLRELREETGIKAFHAQQFAYVEQPINISNMHYFHFGYLVSEFDESQPLINGEPEDIERWEWFDLNKIPPKIASYQREVIIKFLKFNKINFGKK